MAARPKLALGGLVKKATESNILEHGTGDQTGDLTTLIAVERKVVLPVEGGPKVPKVPKVPKLSAAGPKVAAKPPVQAQC